MSGIYSPQTCSLTYTNDVTNVNLITFHNNKLIVDVLKRLLKGNHFFYIPEYESKNTPHRLHDKYTLSILVKMLFEFEVIVLPISINRTS